MTDVIATLKHFGALDLCGLRVCPKCGGFADFDENGMLYTCFFCENTGMVPAAAAAEWERDETDAREYQPLRPVVEGKHLVQRYDSDTGACWDVVQSLLPLELILPKSRRAIPAVDFGDDDIPF